MRKSFKSFMKNAISSILSVTLILSGVSVGVNAASSTTVTKPLKNQVAYYEFTAKDLRKSTSNKSTLSIRLSNKKSGRDKLNLIINEKKKANKNAKIIWDRFFVNNVVKKNYPDLYKVIKTQSNVDKKSKRLLSSNGNTNVAPRTREAIGESAYTFGVTAYNWYGGSVYTLYTDTTWTWTSTGVIGYWPSTKASTFGNSGWYYAGLTTSSHVRPIKPYGQVTINKAGKFIYTSQPVHVNFDFGITKPRYYVNGNITVESNLQITSYGRPSYSFILRPNGGYWINSLNTGY